ncbi:MAG: DUF3782 domain-containing protein [Promethearchaeota archaeon]
MNNSDPKFTINELLEILPRLIRENDTVKGAIITALSGVVATKDDIANLIREMDKRFEAMQEQMDKRFEAMQEQMDKRFDAIDKRFEAMDRRFEAMQAQMDKRFDAIDKRFEAMDRRFEAMQAQMDKRFDEVYKRIDRSEKTLKAAIDNLGGRSGKALEDTILELMETQLIKENVDYKQIRRELLADKKGTIFFKGYSTDIDIVASNGEIHLYEVKYKADQRDVFHFLKNAELYEQVHGVKPDKLFLITLEISKKTIETVKDQPVKIIAGAITSAP